MNWPLAPYIAILAKRHELRLEHCCSIYKSLQAKPANPQQRAQSITKKNTKLVHAIRLWTTRGSKQMGLAHCTTI